MTPQEQRVAIAEHCGWKVSLNGLGNTIIMREAAPDEWHIVDPLNDLNAMYEAERAIGLHDRDKPTLRVQWADALRRVVSVGCPKNRVGSPLVSDIDLLNATAAQRAEAFLRTIGKYKLQ